jgi:dihydroxyacetone kinase-like protein
MVNALNTEQVQECMEYVAISMISKKELLTHADQAIGDGDHGIGMARGFEAALAKLQNGKFSTPEEVFRTVGLALLSSIGGASGAIFGSFFLGAANGLKGEVYLNSTSYAKALQSGLEAVQIRGKARVGDKTMVDALAPAAQAATAHIDRNLSEVSALVYQAAEEGKEKTKGFIATTGKAKTLGERSLGYADPGATSMALILSFINESIKAQTHG